PSMVRQSGSMGRSESVRFTGPVGTPEANEREKLRKLFNRAEWTQPSIHHRGKTQPDWRLISRPSRSLAAKQPESQAQPDWEQLCGNDSGSTRQVDSPCYR